MKQEFTPGLKAIIFDLDGTLIDSLADIAEAVNLMLDDHGHPRRDAQVFRQLIGGAMEALIEQALPPAQRSEEMIIRCVAEYRAHYGRIWQNHTRPYPGMVGVLAKLKARGLRLGVISNKSHAFAQPMTEHFFGTQCFDFIIGRQDRLPQKPHPAMAVEMCSLLDLAPANCAYVGDSGIDMLFARASGMKAVGVLWGFRDEDELRESGAELLLKSADELLGL